MQSQVALVVYSVAQGAKVSTRRQVRQWTADLGFETGVMVRDSPGASFRALAASSRLRYPVGKQNWTIRAERTAHTADYETFTAVTSRGKVSIKVAEVKLFHARRKAEGVVKDTHRLKTRVREGLEGEHLDAARRWVKTFESTYEEVSQTASSAAIRKIIRDELVRYCYPAAGGKKAAGMYVIYEEDIPKLEPLREFMRRMGPAYSLTVLPIALLGDEQRRFFTMAADVSTVEVAREAIDRMERWTRAAPDSRMPREVMVKTFIDEADELESIIRLHEDKIGQTLTASRKELDMLRRMADALQ